MTVGRPDPSPTERHPAHRGGRKTSETKGEIKREERKGKIERELPKLVIATEGKRSAQGKRRSG